MNTKSLMGKCRNWAVSLALVLSSSPACVIKEGLNPDVCSYDPIEETTEEKVGRLGYIKCEEVIPGHNFVLEDRINIVFVNVNLESEDFINRIQNATDCSRENSGFLSQDLFSDNMDRFNFWYMPNKKDANLNLVSSIARKCDGNINSLQNVSAVILDNSKRRPHSGFFSLYGYNLEGNNFESIINLRQNLNLNQVNSESCESFVNSCDLLDRNNDGVFTSEDLAQGINIDSDILQRMCNALNLGECTDANKLIRDYGAAAENYGLNLCRTFSETDLESSLNPNPELCEVLVDHPSDLGFVMLTDYANSQPKMLVHELGHALWNLRDEYTDNIGNSLAMRDELGLNGINCFTGTYDECMQNSNWSHLENTGCFEGCNYLSQGVYRSIENGIMRDESAESFGAYNEERICKSLVLLTGNANGRCDNYLK